ncbi:MAG: tripartite tricarboxylate transporter TctB family protein [Xanthobacteraceae bacterium]|nr:tripartite tricarboxylate transporter TctB family protein [Xanthobacteraceae bacterium]
MTLRTDHVAGAAAIIIGIAVLALSGDLPLGSLSFPGAGMWPKLICVLMIVLGALLCLGATSSKPVAEVGWSDMRHAALVTAATAVAIAFYSTLGFIVIATFLLAGLVMLERGHPLVALIYGASVSVAVYALFTNLLKSPLERGLIGF